MQTRTERWEIGAGKYQQNSLEQRQNEYYQYPDKCLLCCSVMPYIALSDRAERKFCNKSCAAKFNNKNRLRIKGLQKETKCINCNVIFLIGKHANTKNSKCQDCKKYKIIKTKNKICKFCETTFQDNTKKITCSDNCHEILKKNGSSLGGRMSSSKIIRRSKDEIELYNFCKNYFKSVRHNEIIKDGWDADIIIDEYKLAILWNGPWHYKQLNFKNHSLSQVQNRDKIKHETLKKEGWNVVVFEDRTYTPIKAFQFLKEMVAEAGF